MCCQPHQNISATNHQHPSPFAPAAAASSSFFNFDCASDDGRSAGALDPSHQKPRTDVPSSADAMRPPPLAGSASASSLWARHIVLLDQGSRASERTQTADRVFALPARRSRRRREERRLRTSLPYHSHRSGRSAPSVDAKRQVVCRTATAQHAAPPGRDEQFMPHRPSICALSRAPETTPRATYAADSCRSKPVAGAMRPPVNASHAGPEISDGEHIGQASWTGILHTPESLVA